MSEEVSELERQLGQEKTDSDSRLSQLEETHRELRQLRGQVKDREEKGEGHIKVCVMEKNSGILLQQNGQCQVERKVKVMFRTVKMV